MRCSLRAQRPRPYIIIAIQIRKPVGFALFIAHHHWLLVEGNTLPSAAY